MNLSPFILCRFLLGLTPGVLSRLSAENSLESARDSVSGSIPRPPTKSLTLPLVLALLEFPFSPFRDACNLPRSDGGGGVAILEGVRVAGLSVSSADRFGTAGGKGAITAAGSGSIVMLVEAPKYQPRSAVREKKKRVLRQPVKSWERNI